MFLGGSCGILVLIQEPESLSKASYPLKPDPPAPYSRGRPGRALCTRYGSTVVLLQD